LTADSDPLHPKISKTPVILSEQSESKDLRTTDALVGQFGAKIPPRASLGRDDRLLEISKISIDKSGIFSHNKGVFGRRK
jgi:hypothetical protein